MARPAFARVAAPRALGFHVTGRRPARPPPGRLRPDRPGPRRRHRRIPHASPALVDRAPVCPDALPRPAADRRRSAAANDARARRLGHPRLACRCTHTPKSSSSAAGRLNATQCSGPTHVSVAALERKLSRAEPSGVTLSHARRRLARTFRLPVLAALVLATRTAVFLLHLVLLLMPAAQLVNWLHIHRYPRMPTVLAAIVAMVGSGSAIV